MKGIIGFIIALAVVAPAAAQQTVKQPATQDSSQTKPAAPSAAPVVDCACELPLPDVIAVVNGVKLTQKINPQQQRIAELHAEVCSTHRT